MDRDELRAKLRERLRSKRSVRCGASSAGADTASGARARAEEIALSVVGDDAEALGMVMGMLKNPKDARKITPLPEEPYDDEEAPPPT